MRRELVAHQHRELGRRGTGRGLRHAHQGQHGAGALASPFPEERDERVHGNKLGLRLQQVQHPMYGSRLLRAIRQRAYVGARSPAPL
ncbi:hypothetical protein GmRootV59_05590 [Variovorax sp. V59]